MKLIRVTFLFLVSFVIFLSMPLCKVHAYKDMVEESDEDDDVDFNRYEIMYIGGKKLSLELFDYYEEKNDGYVNKKAKWSSSNKNVATVNKAGVVTAQKTGYTFICAEYKGKHYYCEITVYKPHLDYTEISLQKGEKHSIKLVGVEAVSYKSSNNKVASVNSSGQISALTNGKTTITVKGANGKKYKCKVIVTPNNAVESDNILTVLYEDGNEESFDITKEDVVVKENAISVIFGHYPQKLLIGKEITKEIKNAKWDSNGSAVVNGQRYKRVSRMESEWVTGGGNGYDMYQHIVEESVFPAKNDDTYDEVDNGYYYFWSKNEFAYFIYEPIKWDILSIEDKDGSKMLLASHDILDLVKYHNDLHDNYGEVTWETCTLRKWLNDNFLSNTFSKHEQKIIPTVKISTQDETYEDNRGKGGNDTKDKIFLLSLEDVTNEAYGFSSDPDESNFLRRSAVSEYASARGAAAWRHDGFVGTHLWMNMRTLEGKPTTDWLLRSPGWSGNAHCSRIFYNGSAFTAWVDDEEGLKPALYVNCKLGKGVTAYENVKEPQIGGKNILTVQYKNGKCESFDIQKDSIKISGEVKRIYFGRFCQRESGKLDVFLTAKWDEDNNAVINKTKYKRVLYENLYDSSRITSSSFPDDFKLYAYFVYDPISWIPISVEEIDGKKMMLLVSEYILLGCYGSGDYDEKNLTWGTSSIRELLNGEFSSEAFTKKELNKIKSVNITDSDGKETMNKVFMLSAEDVTNTKYGFSEDIDYADINRRASITDYVRRKEGNTMDYWYGTKYGHIASPWDLRPDGKNLIRIKGDGAGEEDYLHLYYRYRPAIYIEIK